MNTKDMHQYCLVNRYATAFLNVFGQKIAPEDSRALPKAEQFFEEHKQACFLMRLSLLDRTVKYEALQKVRQQLGLSECFDTIIRLLIEHKRSELLSDFFGAVAQQIEERQGRMRFVVQVAGTLTDEQKKQLVTFLEQQTQKIVSCIYEQDAALIGGLRLQSNRYLWEASIRDRLNRIRSSLKR